MSLSKSTCECCKALWIEFRLCEELSFSTKKACARVVACWQGELPAPGHCSGTDCTGKCDDVPTSNMPTVCVFNQPQRGATEEPEQFLFMGSKGDRGLACYDDELQRYRIVTMRGGAPIVRFKLTQSLTIGGSAEAVLRTFNGTTYVDGQTIKVFDWWGVSQEGRGMWHAPAEPDMEGWAVRREVFEEPEEPEEPEEEEEEEEERLAEYDIIWMEQLGRFIMGLSTENMDESEPREIAIDRQETWMQGIPPAEQLNVHDKYSMFQDVLRDAICMCVRDEYEEENPNEPYYRIVNSDRACMLCIVELAANLCETIEINTQNINFLKVGPFVTEMDPENIGDVSNPLNHGGSNGDRALLLRINNTRPFHWIIIDVAKHEIKIPIEVRLASQGGCGLEWLMKRVKVEVCDYAPAWESMIGLTEITYATGVQAAAVAGSGGNQEGASCVIQTKLAKLCGFAVSDTVTPENSITLTRIDPLVDLTSGVDELIALHVPMWTICIGEYYNVTVDEFTDCPDNSSGSGDDESGEGGSGQ